MEGEQVHIRNSAGYGLQSSAGNSFMSNISKELKINTVFLYVYAPCVRNTDMDRLNKIASELNYFLNFRNNKEIFNSSCQQMRNSVDHTSPWQQKLSTCSTT